MADLDFALLAEYARTDSAGLFTIVQAGFANVAVKSLPAIQHIAVAAKINTTDEDKVVDVGIVFRAPEGAYEIRTEGGSYTTNRLVANQNHISLVTAIVLPLPVEGTYSVDVEINGEIVRTLDFNVRLQQAK